MPEANVGLTIEELVKLIGVFVAVGTLTYKIVSYFLDRRKESAKAQFAAEGVFRAKQLEIAHEFLDCVGRLMESDSEESFERDWYHISKFYHGPLNLLPDEDLWKAINQFCEFFWENDEYSSYEKATGNQKTYDELHKNADKLGAEVNRYMREQFKQTRSKAVEKKYPKKRAASKAS